MLIRNVFNDLPVLNKVSMNKVLKRFFSQAQVFLTIMEAIEFGQYFLYNAHD